MNNRRVNVRRFVRRRSDKGAAQANGYLADPETSFGKTVSPSTIPVDAAFSARCVVLLGEPGIGKSDVLAERNRRLDLDAMFVDLRWDDSSVVLRDDRVRAWQRGERQLHLVVDSVDEATDPLVVATLSASMSSVTQSEGRQGIAGQVS